MTIRNSLFFSFTIASIAMMASYGATYEANPYLVFLGIAATLFIVTVDTKKHKGVEAKKASKERAKLVRTAQRKQRDIEDRKLRQAITRALKG